MDCSTPGFPVLHCLPEFAPLSQWCLQPSHPLSPLLLPSIFPSIRVFSNESDLHIRWPKYWSFSFTISPSNEYSGLISCRIDRFDLLAIQGTLKSLHYHHNLKSSILQCSAFFMFTSHICTWLLERQLWPDRPLLPVIRKRTRTGTGGDVEKLECSWIAGGNVK